MRHLSRRLTGSRVPVWAPSSIHGRCPRDHMCDGSHPLGADANVYGGEFSGVIDIADIGPTTAAVRAVTAEVILGAGPVGAHRPMAWCGGSIGHPLPAGAGRPRPHADHSTSSRPPASGGPARATSRSCTRGGPAVVARVASGRLADTCERGPPAQSERSITDAYGSPSLAGWSSVLLATPMTVKAQRTHESDERRGTPEALGTSRARRFRSMFSARRQWCCGQKYALRRPVA